MPLFWLPNAMHLHLPTTGRARAQPTMEHLPPLRQTTVLRTMIRNSITANEHKRDWRSNGVKKIQYREEILMSQAPLPQQAAAQTTSRMSSCLVLPLPDFGQSGHHWHCGPATTSGWSAENAMAFVSSASKS